MQVYKLHANGHLYLGYRISVYSLFDLVSGIRQSSIIARVQRPMDVWHMIGVLRLPVLDRRGHSRSLPSCVQRTPSLLFADHGQWRRYPRYWWLRARRKSHRTRYQHRARGFTIREEAGRDLDLCQLQRWRSKVESLSPSLHRVDMNTRS